MRNRIAIAITALAIGTGAAAAFGSPPADDSARVAPGYGSTATVRGCAHEDTCRIGYHADGTWTITRDRH
jgi:hypothetical protein